MKAIDISKVVQSLEAIGYEVKLNPDWYGSEHTLRIKKKNCDANLGSTGKGMKKSSICKMELRRDK